MAQMSLSTKWKQTQRPENREQRVAEKKEGKGRDRLGV